MPEYRRAVLPGGTFFFTVVTYQRKPILISAEAREILRFAWLDVKQRFPFTTDAICLLPDHIHCIWTLPMGDTNYSIRWKEIKRLFSRQYNRQIGNLPQGNSSRRKREEVTLWQRRFWEHTIRDETDYQNHLNYIHYNPVKHELVKQVNLWPWSSFHRYVREGFYESDWGSGYTDGSSNLFGE
jgi:putative transposase